MFRHRNILILHVSYRTLVNLHILMKYYEDMNSICYQYCVSNNMTGIFLIRSDRIWYIPGPIPFVMRIL